MQNIDAYIDGELSGEERAQMDRHAGECAQCARLLEQASQLMTLCQGLNDDLEVPLSAQAAWRKAVRAEAQKKKRPALNGWTRGLAAVAAALVVLVTGSYGLRDVMPASTGIQPDMMEYAAANSIVAYETDAQPQGGMLYRNTTAAGYMLRTDGSEAADSTTDEGTTRSANSGETQRSAQALKGVQESVLVRSARREIVSNQYEADCVWLDNLVSEYDAYFAERGEKTLQQNTARELNAHICVPSDRLDEFLMELNQLGQTTLKNDYARDVTAQYLDAQAQAEALNEQRIRLEEYLANAQELEEKLAIDERLTDIRAQLQRLEGEMSGQVSYSNITLTMTERMPEQAAAAQASVGERMKSGFDESMTWLRQFGQNALVTLAVIAPRLVVWIPALIIVVILLRVVFRRGK